MSALVSYLQEPSWKTVLEGEFAKPYFKTLEAELARRAKSGVEVFPPRAEIFSAFQLTPFAAAKVVILGQDPYHGPGQAMGLSFSVPEGVKIPPSLRNMIKEIESDVGACALSSGDLTGWARQGVLLLNTSLSVEARKAGSHSKLGWAQLTDAAIAELSRQRDDLVFMLWGGHAQKKAALIDAEKHLVLSGPHPSPLSAYRGFFGCRHFSRANAYLAQAGLSPIEW